MNAKEFDKYKTALYKKYGAVKSEISHEAKINTPFGTLYISAGWKPRIKVASIHSRLEGDKEKFKTEISSQINTYNGKCNFYFNSPLDCLDELEEYLSNCVKDLFEYYEEQPQQVKDILSRYELDAMDYINCENLFNELNAINYTFDYGLNAVPFNLRKMAG